jgi:hypothetical protein
VRLFNRLWYGALAIAVVFGMGGCEPQGYQLKRIQCFTVEGERVTDEVYEVQGRSDAWVDRPDDDEGLTCIVSYRD